MSKATIKIKFPKKQATCERGCYSSLHDVAQLAGKNCIGCDKCTGWKVAK